MTEEQVKIQSSKKLNAWMRETKIKTLPAKRLRQMLGEIETYYTQAFQAQDKDFVFSSAYWIECRVEYGKIHAIKDILNTKKD